MKSRSIKQYLVRFWLYTVAACTLFATLLSFGLSYLDYSRSLSATRSQLQTDAKTIARSLSGEVLLKSEGRSNYVAEQLRKEFGLSVVRITQIKTGTKNPHAIGASQSLPGVEPKQFVYLEKPSPKYREYINSRNFVLSLISILTLALIGFFFQLRFLRRHIIRPIESLAATSAGQMPVNPKWATEIQTIANGLTDSFSNREQAIFGQLAKGLIHDLRTLLNSIEIARQLVETKSIGTEARTERLEKLFNVTQSNLLKVKKLIDQSLDGSREIKLQKSASDIQTTIQQSIQSLESCSQNSQITIHNKLTSSTVIEHDSLQLERVFTNLVKNAIEATDATQKPTIIDISMDESPQGLRIAIADNGTGISDTQNAFRPFHTTKQHGYGLGLFVSKKIIEAHSGHIAVDQSSDLGGAKFTITLPTSRGAK